jgi:hypothetical protein
VQFPANVKLKLPESANPLTFSRNYSIAGDPAIKVISHLPQPTGNQVAGIFPTPETGDDNDRLISARFLGRYSNEIKPHHYAFAIDAGKAIRPAVDLRNLCGLPTRNKYGRTNHQGDSDELSLQMSRHKIILTGTPKKAI